MINHEVTSLVPEMQEKVHAFFADARSQGLPIYIFEARRSLDRQYELFGKGRTAQECAKYGVPAIHARPKLGKPVTWRLDSKHLSGMAIDIVFDISKNPEDYTKPWDKKIPSWSGDWGKVIEIAKKHGLKSLAPYEQCHLEI